MCFLGFRVSGFRVEGLQCVRVCFRVWGSGFRISVFFTAAMRSQHPFGKS